MKRIVVLGSTGSIGCNVLDVVAQTPSAALGSTLLVRAPTAVVTRC